jgi:hypothetical protein
MVKASSAARWAGAALALLPLAAHAADAAHPTVVEIFQSQGCSSCPPANANVIALSDRPDLLTLSFGVTYWDQLGWKDTFASPKYTARQWDYAKAFRRDEVATPEVVVNGREDVVGNRRPELEALIARVDRGSAGPAVSIAGGAVTVGAGKAGPAEVLAVRYDPNIEQVAIRRGENGGRTLPHKNVVKDLVRLGEWSGRAQTYTLPAHAQDGLKTAILVQQGPGGPIIAAARAS